MVFIKLYGGMKGGQEMEQASRHLLNGLVGLFVLLPQALFSVLRSKPRAWMLLLGCLFRAGLMKVTWSAHSTEGVSRDQCADGRIRRRLLLLLLLLCCMTQSCGWMLWWMLQYDVKVRLHT